MARLQLLEESQSVVPIVAIGASAGGVTALQKLFSTLPPNQPYAFVVLLHLPADRPSGFADLIAKWTPMAVHPATDGIRPERNAVYVPSPDHILTIENGVFRTRSSQGGSRRPGIDTIDTFLESLAQHHGPRAIAIILSGTGMDGTAGAVCIRQADGIVIVQDPLTALHDGMPNAVIQRGIHDHVLPVGAMGRQLAVCASPGYVRPEQSADWKGDMSETLGRIVRLIRQRIGFDLSGYKPSPLLWRVEQRMEVRKVWSFDDYAFLIEDDPIEMEALARGLPIHVTEFFRDSDAWNALHREVLGPLLRETKGARPIRIWTPACSTGEEAYSVAILLDEIAQEQGITPNFQIFATDAAPDLVAKASRGLFRESSLTGVSASRLKRYFYSVDGGFRVKRLLREKMVFAPQNLISDPPFAGLDLVTCRNLFIYLEPDTVREVLTLIHGSLQMGGFLFLGNSEALRSNQGGFETVSREWNIYRKVGAIPSLGRTFVPKAASDHPTSRSSALRVASEQYDVPSVLIDEECSVLQVYGDTGSVLCLPPGEATLKLTDLVPRPWALQLRLGIQEAFAGCEPITLTKLQDRVAESDPLSVRITPLRSGAGAVCDRMLVSFIRDSVSMGLTDVDGEKAGLSDLDMSISADWKDKARISREELEASREELQALNEELRASNEQLNRSNDDLNDANVQLQDMIGQLALQSRVLLSGEVMTLSLDQDLRVRWFTPAIQEVLPLGPDDTGRFITDLVLKLHGRDFLVDIQDVLGGAELREAVVRSGKGRYFMRRIYPYTAADSGGIAGVAITFVDISERISVHRALRRSQDWLSAQKEAFQAAMNNAPLEVTLGILIRTLMSQTNDGRRCAFYIADGDVLRHVVGMSDAYALCVDGFRISPESIACGLAVATGEPVITQDVFDEPRWQPWMWLARQFGYRGCWSFPIETSERTLVGSLAMYFEEPHAPSPLDLELAEAFTQTAAILIWRHRQTAPFANSLDSPR